MEEVRKLLTSTSTYNWNALKIAQSSPDFIIPLIQNAGLRGRGGSGFPTAIKWKSAKEAEASEKFVICNADEGEPGTFKDRVLIEKNPYAIIEGMAICGTAIGARKGYIYLRGEYAHLFSNLASAVADLPDPEFKIEICMGHGSYLAGEETALLNAMEGLRAEPRIKPPFPVNSGLKRRPTVINNAETFANVPIIVEHGAKAFREYGTEQSPGTKLICVSGNIVKPGVYEFPLGTTIGQIFQYTRACQNEENLKGVQVGGGSGTIVGIDALKVAMDYESCAKAGLSFGTGDLMFFSNDCNIVKLCLSAINFFAKESCGKCVSCRQGCKYIKALLDGTKRPRGIRAIEDLEEVCNYMQTTSFCGLGQAAAVPILSAIKAFPMEFTKYFDEMVQSPGGRCVCNGKS